MLEPSEIAPERPRPLLRAEYDRLVSLGFFEEERIELLYGVLVRMSPQDPEHSFPIERLTSLLLPPLVGRAILRIQLPFAASDDSEPEPDVAIVPPEDYRRRHPDAAWLIVEVAASSLAKDRNVKSRLYAENGVLEYWIVDTAARAVHAYRDPADGRYASVVTVRSGERLTLQKFPDVGLDVDALF